MEGKLSTVDRFLMKECMEEYQLLLTIPGISDNGCATILAEIGPNEENFFLFYQRISSRGSKMKAIIACGYKMLRIIYKILAHRQILLVD